MNNFSFCCLWSLTNFLEASYQNHMSLEKQMNNTKRQYVGIMLFPCSFLCLHLIFTIIYYPQCWALEAYPQMTAFLHYSWGSIFTTLCLWYHGTTLFSHIYDGECLWSSSFPMIQNSLNVVTSLLSIGEIFKSYLAKQMCWPHRHHPNFLGLL